MRTVNQSTPAAVSTSTAFTPSNIRSASRGSRVSLKFRIHRGLTPTPRAVIVGTRRSGAGKDRATCGRARCDEHSNGWRWGCSWPWARRVSRWCAQAGDPAVITGVVTSGAGPEAGVWVIAETGDLPTKFRKIVVTDDDGRFLLPELPEASYSVWVRGYGLVDSTPVNGRARVRTCALTAAVAQTPQEAAAVYPAAHWLSLIDVPEADEFPGTGPDGNGISEQLRTRDEYLYNVKACLRCHQVGGEFTRGHPNAEEYDSAPTLGTRGCGWGSAGPR